MPMSATRAHEERSAAAIRLERAIDSAIEVLGRLERTKSVRDLAVRASELREQIRAWPVAPPARDAREAAMRSALSIHLAALALLREGSRAAPPERDGRIAG